MYPKAAPRDHRGDTFVVAAIGLRRPAPRWLVPLLVIAIVALVLAPNLIELGMSRVRPAVAAAVVGGGGARAGVSEPVASGEPPA